MAARTDQKWSAALIRRMARLADQEMSTAQIAKALGLARFSAKRVASASRRRTQPTPKKAGGGKWHTLNRRPDRRSDFVAS
jgi:hypothetical protein